MTEAEMDRALKIHQQREEEYRLYEENKKYQIHDVEAVIAPATTIDSIATEAEASPKSLEEEEIQETPRTENPSRSQTPQTPIELTDIPLEEDQQRLTEV